MMRVAAQSPGETEFHQAVHEVVESVMPIVQSKKAYRDAKVLDRMVVPENVIMFRVVWTDDSGAGAGEPGLSRPDEQRDWSLQRRLAVPSVGELWAC